MALLSVTDRAAGQMKALLAGRETPALGLRFGTDKKGCSGLSYKIDFVEEANPGDELFETRGIHIYIERESLLFIMGSEIDYEEGQFASGFVFVNPNEKSRCGCGESFNV